MPAPKRLIITVSFWLGVVLITTAFALAFSYPVSLFFFGAVLILISFFSHLHITQGDKDEIDGE